MKSFALAALISMTSVTVLAQEIDYSEITENIIFKGSDVSPKERVSQVTVYLKTQLKDGQILGNMTMSSCSGSLIASDIVLTAAHCVEGFKKAEVSELTELVVQYRALNSKKLLSVKIKQFAMHPKYANKAGPFDIAVIQLQKPILDRRPMRLVQPGDYRNRDTVTVAGFGTNDRPKTDIKKDPVILKYFAQANQLPNTEAGEKEKADLAAKIIARISELQNQDVLLLKTQMETFLMDFPDGKVLILKPDETTICKGDSGGPTFLKVGDQLLQVGVHSGGVGVDCKYKKKNFVQKFLNPNDVDGMGVDVFVPLVRDWIRAHIAKFQAQKDI